MRLKKTTEVSSESRIVAKSGKALPPEEIVKSVNDYISHIKKLCEQFQAAGTENTDYVLFRGQDKDWHVLPSLARITKRFSADNVRTIEEKILRGFARRIVGHGRQFDFELDLLALAQHHGAGTRCLDWTRNALAALWFAVSQPMKKSDNDNRIFSHGYGAVWVFAAKETELLRHKDYGKYEVHCQCESIALFEPNHVSPRITAQSGFLMAIEPLEDHDDDSSLGNSFPVLHEIPSIQDRLRRILIPFELYADIRSELDRLGVNQSTIFPDLDGAAKHETWLTSLLADEREA